MRVAVQPHNRQASQFSAEIITDPRDPGAVDEAEINVRVGAKSLDQLGRRMFERFPLSSEGLRAVSRSSRPDKNQRAQTSELAEVSESMDAPVSFRAR
jgi:hypothetical protein